ncbi:MAG: phage protease [Thermodesulfobacteriota bacterium]
MTKQKEGAALPEWILLLPAGRVELLDRPEPLQVDPESLAAMVTAFRSRGVDLVIDYEHQSLQGRQAPAAGWIKDLEARGDGLWGRVEWTPQAREYLRNREYRYFSPVLQLDPETKKPLALMQVGLTNVPAIKRLAPLVAKWEDPGPQAQEQNPRRTLPEGEAGKDKPMEQLRLLLGLSREAGDEALWTGVIDLCRNLATTLKLPEEATAAQILEATGILQQKAQRAAEAEEELRQLKSRLAAETTEKTVEEALKAGKITPAQRTWALEYYRQDPGGFQTFVARAPQLVPTGRELELFREDGRAPGHLAPEELVLCRSLNLAPEQYLQAKARTH